MWLTTEALKYPRFHISSFFLKFYCQSIFFRNINFVDIFLLPLVLTMTNYDIFNLSILSWFLLLLVTLLSVFVAKTEVMGKAFQESFTSRRFFILAVTFWILRTWSHSLYQWGSMFYEEIVYDFFMGNNDWKELL